MRNKRLVCGIAVVLFLCGSGLWAGDIASFADLGFSTDGRTFMFAQYGVQSRTLKPWADLFVVDIPENDFVSGGRISFINDNPVSAGQDGSGALYRLIAQNAALADRYRINYCFQGRPLYISLNNNPEGTLAQLPVEFTDFTSGAGYSATLVPRVEGSGANLNSSFSINLLRTARDGTRKTYTVGTPNVKRPQIASYHIRRVMISPNGNALIFVIEMRKQEGVDFDVRYMVEALWL
jgi:predicted secreted protein